MPLYVVFLVSFAQLADAQVRLVVQDESELWIDGSSSINTFTCKANIISGFGDVHDKVSTRTGADVAEVTVPVGRFDCGNQRMNEDFYHALKAEDYPYIQFQLIDAAPAAKDPVTGTESMHLYVAGHLSIAGTARTIQVTVQGKQLSNGMYQATGKIPLKMSDFGIDPPTAIFGLIQANDKITVHFNLIAAAKEQHFTG